MRLIDADALNAKKVYSKEFAENVVTTACIDFADTVKASIISTGEWRNGLCTNCGGHAPFWQMASTYYQSNYCPNCGAKMDVMT